MREIGVHLKGRIVVVADRVLEAGYVSRTQAELCGAVQHMDLVILLCEPFGKLPCSVRGIVVHDEDIGGRGMQKDLPQEQGKILSFVIRRDDNQGFHRSARLAHRCPFLYTEENLTRTALFGGMVRDTLPSTTEGVPAIVSRLYICSLRGRNFSHSVGRRDMVSPRQRDRTSHEASRCTDVALVPSLRLLTERAGASVRANEHGSIRWQRRVRPAL